MLDDQAMAEKWIVRVHGKEYGPVDIETLQRYVRKAAGRFVSDRTRRRPMIVPVVMEA